MTTSLRVLAAICATIVWIESGHADCSSLRALAQQHANDMARRNSLDHAGFMERRGPAGAIAENVAMGCETEACARRMWMQSPRHRANMMLGGCQAVASAVSASGRRYWAMEIGGNSRSAARHANVRHIGVTLARATRRGSGHDGLVGRDFSIDGSNAP
ncbi:MAG TPA: CAP domain-containing protein [Pseudolabrys sp.]|nr:CAP domain-containing protein [Pseudolabrys sp.]